MEGPTPVSALIHAATMVTAGIFLILKCSVLFEYVHIVLLFLLLIGGLTAFVSGTIGVAQFDIKKVIAYSTCSQLGYMLVACGASNFFVSFFHLMNHAFFKALLFLCAGCIIHSCNGEQDFRAIGGIARQLPIIFIFMLVGGLALGGFAFLTGFYSKDFILEQFLFMKSSYDLGLL
jgi:NADH-ubiquinone oxidoreductase chain 5